jgi:putative IMPACT (imprinted ancient) family translation regulator
MLTALLKEDLENVVVVVTRYFGGIKLGAGGLTRAYGGAVADGLAVMPRVVREVRPIWEATLPHGDAGRIQEDLLRQGAVVRGVEYGQSVSVRLTYNGDVLELLARTSQGKVVPHLIGQDIIEVPVDNSNVS